MRAIAFVKRLIADQKLDPGRYKDLRVHMIGDDAALEPFGAASKMSTDPRLLAHLFDLGRGAAMAWLARHRGDLGKRSTVDIEANFLGPSARGALPR
jgi:NTE family protein